MTTRRRARNYDTRQAVIYARFSPRPNAAECESCDKQIERCKQWALAKDLAVIGVHRDDGLSGATADDRPGLQDALQQVESEGAVMVCVCLSRFARSIPDAVRMVDRIGDSKGHLATLDEGIDTRTAQGQLVFLIFSWLAQVERENIAERTSQAMLQHQANGRVMGSRPPYGWRRRGTTRKLVEDKREQEVLGRIVASAKAGRRPNQIATLLNSEGIKPRIARKWSRQSIRQILEREGLA